MPCVEYRDTQFAPSCLNTPSSNKIRCLLRCKQSFLHLLSDKGNVVQILMAGTGTIPAERLFICMFEIIYGDNGNEVVSKALHVAFSLTLVALTCVITQ